jgi:uncharacterized paraquat-inducible protein A
LFFFLFSFLFPFLFCLFFLFVQNRKGSNFKIGQVWKTFKKLKNVQS